jgi:error-prone DNA polymerase
MAGRNYVPLWCKTHYSFLEGASSPEEIVRTAAAHGLSAVAVTDRDGMYGAVRAHREAENLGIQLILGSQLSVSDGSRVLVLATSRGGYSRLCRLISVGRLRCEKGQSSLDWDDIIRESEGLIAILLPDCTGRDGRGPDTDNHNTPGRSSVKPGLTQELGRLYETFGSRLYRGVVRHRSAGDREQDEEFVRTLERFLPARSLPEVALTEVLYHHRNRRSLQDVLTCIRHRTTLDRSAGILRPNAEHAVLPAAGFVRLFRDKPEAVEATREIARRCSFSLSGIRYRYPSRGVSGGYTEAGLLEKRTFEGARRRYGTSVPDSVRVQLRKELEIITELEYSGYFLTMWELVEFCRSRNILCQGRGSAANSAVCYCLGITAIDPVRMNLLFERFISRERAEPPDIDLDIEHRRREEVISYVYETYGRDHAAMVANIVRYRPRSAVREVGKVLGMPEAALDRAARLLGRYHDGAGSAVREAVREAGLDPFTGVTAHLVRLSEELIDTPRHLSIHPGGFLLGSEPVHTIVPVENASMPGRTVIQWDKYDIEALGLFKVDLLGLGALTHLHYGLDLLKTHYGLELSPAEIPPEDDRVFRMLGRADTVGVFQLESRAQMATLPRMKPKRYYDLVIEISIIRPGPIVGGMAHAYLKRRNGEELIRYPHESLRPVLEKTLGVPVFQEQVMKVAMIAADYTPGEADQLRRDMAAWRQHGRIDAHRDRLISGMEKKGISREFASQVFDQIRGFGEYGFPESHAASFALIAYCTAWLRCRYPEVFTCALLNAWPMGFYAPSTILEDARRHGIEVRPVCVFESRWDCALELLGSGMHQTAPDSPRTPSGQSGREKRFAIRIGLRFVRGLGRKEYDRLERAREKIMGGGIMKGSRNTTEGGTGRDRDALLHDETAFRMKAFFREAALSREVRENLAVAGAFSALESSRRSALWAAAEEAGKKSPVQEDSVDAALRNTIETLRQYEQKPDFIRLSGFEEISWDYDTLGHSTAGHPMEQWREGFTSSGVVTAESAMRMPDGCSIRYAGMVICRQRPSTAGGTVFFTLEDETGFLNLILKKEIFDRYRVLLLTRSLVGVAGVLQHHSGVVHLLVRSCFDPVRKRAAKGGESVASGVRSRDFQ